MRNSAGQGERERRPQRRKNAYHGIWPIGEGLAMGGEGKLIMAKVQESPHIPGGNQHFLTQDEKTECFPVTKEGVASR